jgi:transcriptional regulator with XRE-family HTH domain
MQTIGERLEEARKRKGISIREASESTKIRSDYLQKFESNTFEISLPDIYVRGFLRTYAHFLKLNPEKLLTDYAGLGLGEIRETRRHQDQQREIMGRLDIPESPKPQPAVTAQTVAEPPAQRPQLVPRSTPTAVVTGAPSADRRKQLKVPLIVGGAAVALIVLIFVIRAILPSSPAPASGTASRPVPPVETPDGDVVRLIAIDNVQVKVIQQNNQQELFSGDLAKGETRYIRKDGKIQVTYNPGRNLRVEVRGKQYKMTIDGSGQNTLQ